MRSVKDRVLSFMTAVSIVILSLPQFVIPAFADDNPVRDEPIIVSLGDSYASGEGNAPFFGQDNKKVGDEVNPDWIAHRSESAWTGMLTLTGGEGPVSAHRGTNWFFAAASNARITHKSRLPAGRYL